jgi:signal transduction histidine kinase
VRRRLLLSYLSLTLFVLLALELPLGLSFDNGERNRLIAQVHTEAFAMALRVDEPLAASGSEDGAALTQLAAEFQRNTHNGVTVVDMTGHVVVATGRGEPRVGTDLSSRAEIASALKGRQATGERELRTGSAVTAAVPVLNGSGTVGAVRVTASLAVVADNSRSNWLLLLALGGLVALVVLLVSVLLARSFTRPLKALDEGAARLGDGDLATRVQVPADPPELRGLARSFNATAERLEQLVRSQQAFVADASHQLRTPLAALSLRLENLEAEVPELPTDDLDGAIAETRRLGRLVDALLALARAEQAPPASADVALGPVVGGRIDAWRAVAAERDISIEARVDGVVVRSVPGRLEQVLDNLLSNALDAAPPRSIVFVEARRHSAAVTLEVRDAGPGMTPEHRSRAFDRFWRADPSRKDRGGFGLGLAIVNRLVTADGGNVRLGDAPEGGLAVTMQLPAANPNGAGDGTGDGSNYSVGGAPESAPAPGVAEEAPEVAAVVSSKG